MEDSKDEEEKAHVDGNVFSQLQSQRKKFIKPTPNQIAPTRYLRSFNENCFSCKRKGHIRVQNIEVEWT